MRAGIFLILSLLFFTSCDEKRVFEESHVFKNETWNKDDAAIFRVHVTDTVNPHRFFFTLRNTGQYPYSNLHIFLATQFPDSSMAVDTMELLLADPSGKWLGKGTGDLYENRILFRDRVVFPDIGIYIFTMKQGMRMDNLPHILDAGLRIELQ